MKSRVFTAFSLFFLTAPLATPRTSAAAEYRVGSPPEALAKSLQLSPFYSKHIDAGGLPILSSAKVSDFALLEAAFLVDRLLAHRPEIRRALIASKTRLAVMAVDELTTDIPEHSDLHPKQYWNRRARGLGATDARPAVSCGEENLLGLRGDPYATENILIHEFAHAMHQMGLDKISDDFDRRLRMAYEQAMQAGLWKGKYAATNRHEYWAEGAQSWFDANRPPDHDHNEVDTREELKAYDPGLAALAAEVFGDGAWRYVKPAARKAAERGHLIGFDPQRHGRFAWPEELKNLGSEIRARALRERGSPSD